MDFENPGLKDWALRFVRRRWPDLSGPELEQAAQRHMPKNASMRKISL